VEPFRDMFGQDLNDGDVVLVPCVVAALPRTGDILTLTPIAPGSAPIVTVGCGQVKKADGTRREPALPKNLREGAG
jgi:hypothetical protein